MYQHNSFGFLAKVAGGAYQYVNKIVVPLGKLSGGGEIDLSGNFIDGEATTYAELGTAADHSNEIWYVREPSGTWPINYRGAGWYYSNGTSWTQMPNSAAASKVKYDNRDATLSSTDVKSALDESDDKYEAHVGGSDDRHDMSAIDVTTKVGDPTPIEDLNQIYNHMYSSGVMHGCDITDNGDGTVSFTSGYATLRDQALHHTQIYSVEVQAQNNLALVDGSINYIYLGWNGGSPKFFTSTSSNSFNCQDKCVAYYAVRVGNEIGYVDLRGQNVDLSAKTRRLFLDFSRFIPTQGGSIISEAGNLGIGVTSGSFYLMIKKIDHPEFDTSISGTANENVFSLYYRDGAGGWTEVVDSKVVDTTVYDDGSGTPATLKNNRYGVSWVYVCNNSPSTLCVLMGQEEYRAQVGAENASIPSELPPMISGLGALVGIVVYKKGASNFDNVLSAFDTTFSSSQPTTHNSLSGLQGGAVDQYYHLTLPQYDRVNTDGVFYMSDPDTDGTFRLFQDGDSLKIQKRVSGTYTDITSFS